jgi:hypothetical protein
LRSVRLGAIIKTVEQSVVRAASVWSIQRLEAEISHREIFFDTDAEEENLGRPTKEMIYGKLTTMAKDRQVGELDMSKSETLFQDSIFRVSVKAPVMQIALLLFAERILTRALSAIARED